MDLDNSRQNIQKKNNEADSGSEVDIAANYKGVEINEKKELPLIENGKKHLSVNKCDYELSADK